MALGVSRIMHFTVFLCVVSDLFDCLTTLPTNKGNTKNIFR